MIKENEFYKEEELEELGLYFVDDKDNLKLYRDRLENYLFESTEEGLLLNRIDAQTPMGPICLYRRE